MALSKLDNLYRQVILDHSSHPHHHGSLDASSQTIEMNNPTCGDVIELQLDIQDNIIKDIAFNGSGCSISTASASMMTDAVIGKSLTEAEQLAEDFSQLVQGNEVSDEEKLGDAAMLGGVAKFPARIKCATLAWKALEQAVENDGQGTAGQLHCEE
ncbi:SUF system NifU family Fe-S cluster assembly protein [Enterococcus sp. DIV0242_7C1]|uniref:NifU family SUF system FeS assembly protein n=1 Tax=Candidatus Enterococcus dunnyi TaxID=1834192 RepID=A0A200JE77_9ENTE|nr:MULTISPECIES: SUF system NifU family Fe-S cluster assembly protein [unclassified Enterococcus]MBO0469523.1 SUF system NifU family Fe-S cluster assembly protein [Enterococcus sp. DIV0242_7C1]MCA5011948.1 SUF system NifU family Fe-S cluster assembly protein [Enterococcus sp. S23]MCA5014610.1 SUF system NifU family Fe-S cluster assembly protein [Enterococcus sp. S22(2020)]OUZ35191.1 NifU family SUF system FeS assembly protein [Enterococcus sp. 9D6_DIV0238]